MKCGCGVSIIYIPTKKSGKAVDKAKEQATIKAGQALVAEDDRESEEHVKFMRRRLSAEEITRSIIE